MPEAEAAETNAVAVYLTPPAGRAIPFDLAAGLMAAIGAAYPHTRIGPSSPDSPGGMQLLIDPADRVNAEPPDVRVNPDEIDDLGAGVSRFEDGTLTVQMPHDAGEALAAWACELLTTADGAVNYVEQQATTADYRRLVVIAAWSPDKTPHELRMAAEKRAERAEHALAAEARAEQAEERASVMKQRADALEAEIAALTSTR